MFLSEFKEEAKKRLGVSVNNYQEAKKMLFDENKNLSKKFRKDFEDCDENSLGSLCYDLLNEIKDNQERRLQNEFFIIVKDGKFYNVETVWAFVNVDLGLDCVESTYNEIFKRAKERGYKFFKFMHEFTDFLFEKCTLEEMQKTLDILIEFHSNDFPEAKKLKDALENTLRKQVYTYLLKRLDPENERKDDLGFIKDCEFFANVLIEDAQNFSVMYFDKERNRYETIYLDKSKFI